MPTTITIETDPSAVLIANEIEIAKKLLTAHNSALLMRCLQDEEAQTIPLADLCGLIISEEDTDFLAHLGIKSLDHPLISLTTKVDWLDVLTVLESPPSLRTALMAPPIENHLRVMIAESPIFSYWEVCITPKPSKGQILDEA